MKHYALLFIFIAVLTGCKNTSNIEEELLDKAADTIAITDCSIDSLSQLPWAVKLVNGQGPCQYVYVMSSFTMYNYKGGKIFYLNNPNSQVAICSRMIFNCKGEVLYKGLSEDIVQYYSANKQSAKVLWEKKVK